MSSSDKSVKQAYESLKLANREYNTLKPSTEDPPMLKLKALPQHLKYAYLDSSETLPIIIVANLSE